MGFCVRFKIFIIVSLCSVTFSFGIFDVLFFFLLRVCFLPVDIWWHIGKWILGFWLDRRVVVVTFEFILHDLPTLFYWLLRLEILVSLVDKLLVLLYYCYLWLFSWWLSGSDCLEDEIPIVVLFLLSSSF